MFGSRPAETNWRRLFILATFVAGLCLYGAMLTDTVHRRLEAVPYYARTYLHKFRPTPEMPTPPPVSAAALQDLLQQPTATATAPPTATATASPTATAPPPASAPAATPAMLLTSAQVATLPVTSSAPLTASTLLDPTPEAAPASPAQAVTVAPVAPQVTLTGFKHQYQTWNNCGPATITTYLSYYGRTETQAEAAQVLKPDRDDKNVSPDEMAAYARSLGFAALIRTGGHQDLLKLLLSNSLPVIVETWMEPEDLGGMGHYRLLTGYNEAEGYFTVQDSYYGPNLKMPFAALDQFWRVFNRKYILVYRPDQAELVQTLLGPTLQDQFMDQQTLQTAQAEAQANPADPFAWFNLGASYTHLGQPDLAASAFDEARRLGLPFRMLWYQFEIYEAYLAAGRYQDVIDLATATLRGVSDLEESYYYRGLARQALGQPDAAREDFQAALTYNPHFTPAAEALATLTAQ